MYEMTLMPRFGDVDGLRHINNTKLPEWFELAREPVFRIFNPDMNLESWNLIMARISVDFMKPMRLGREVTIRTWVKAIGRTSITLHQEAWQNGERCAAGEAVAVHYDFAAERAAPVPEACRAALAEHLS